MEGGPPCFPPGSTCPVVLRLLYRPYACLSPTGLLPPVAGLSSSVRLGITRSRATAVTPYSTYYPRYATAAAYHAHRVWAVPRSLAATWGISVDFSSSGYLDVSVPQVPFHDLCIQSWMTRYYPRRVPPFGYPRIYACLRLPEAFRSLPRPSSAPGAKASTVRPY